MERDVISRYRLSLQTGEIKEPFFGPYGNDVIADFGLSVPCMGDEFHARWSETSMKPYPEQRRRFLEAISTEHLRNALGEQPETEITYRICDLKGKTRCVRSQIELVFDGCEPFAAITNYEVQE